MEYLCRAVFALSHSLYYSDTASVSIGIKFHDTFSLVMSFLLSYKVRIALLCVHFFHFSDCTAMWVTEQLDIITRGTDTRNDIDAGIRSANVAISYIISCRRKLSTVNVAYTYCTFMKKWDDSQLGRSTREKEIGLTRPTAHLVYMCCASAVYT